MRITVRAHPGARHETVRRVGESALEIWIRAPALDGRANERIIQLLSDILGVRKSAVRILRGHSSREKLVEVEGLDHARLGMTGVVSPD